MTNDTKTFDELLEEANAENNEEKGPSEGDTCPENHCQETLHGLEHPRASEFDTEAAAPEEEVVCIHDGIIRAE